MKCAPIKVMVVEDEPQYRFLVKTVLEVRAGWKVIEATNGKECLDKMENDRPDLVLMDIMMPGMDGWEACKKIKEGESTKSTKVVMLSVRDSSADRLKSTHCRADMHIGKSGDFNELIESVKEVLLPVKGKS